MYPTLTRKAGPEKARKRRHPPRGMGTEEWISSREFCRLTSTAINSPGKWDEADRLT
jgi:hypothetical protein